MAISAERLDLVRRRAKFTCEYCGVSEIDTGGQLTLDHYQPTTRGGSDEPENLVYCCFRCNLNKADYWPSTAGELFVWNPRAERAERHLIRAPDGRLLPRTEVGGFTIALLRLNRPELLVHRRLGTHAEERERLLRKLRDLLAQAAQARKSQVQVLNERTELLSRLERILRQLLGKAD